MDNCVWYREQKCRREVRDKVNKAEVPPVVQGRVEIQARKVIRVNGDEAGIRISETKALKIEN